MRLLPSGVAVVLVMASCAERPVVAPGNTTTRSPVAAPGNATMQPPASTHDAAVGLTAACAPPSPHARPTTDDVLALTDQRSSDVPRTMQARVRIREVPEEALDVLHALVRSSDDETLANVRPDALLSEVQTMAPRPARHAAECIAAIYAERAERLRTEPARARTARSMAEIGQFVRSYAVSPLVCVTVPCEDGEICVHPCCGGPCDPAPPYCVKRKADASACASVGAACPGCVEQGRDVVCRCTSP